MNNEVLFLLLDRYADHESVFVTAGINCEETQMREKPKFVVKTVAPDLQPVCSCGGFRTVPDYSIDTMPADYAALILIGGYGWLDERMADRVVPIVKDAIDKGRIVGAICNAASFLAKHGFLNDVKHTGNGPEQLRLWGGDNYRNEAGYVNSQAVCDGRIVTANGTGALEFAKELLLLLEVDTPEWIERFYQFNKLGFVEIMRMMRQG